MSSTRTISTSLVTDTKQLFDDIQNGEKNKLPKEFAVIELSETRPLFPTNMPELLGWWRQSYPVRPLKGWNLKTANNLYSDIESPKREGGMSKATYVGLKNIRILALAGAKRRGNQRFGSWESLLTLRMMYSIVS